MIAVGALVRWAAGRHKDPGNSAGRIYCLPIEQSELKSGLAVPFSMWQCGGHGDAAGSGFVH